MINEINTELFVELSNEQQQVVAGGCSSYEAPNDKKSDLINSLSTPALKDIVRNASEEDLNQIIVGV